MRRKDREVTSESEIREILDLCKTCHVAIRDEDLYVVPLSYGYTLTDGRLCLYFHSAHEGRKLELFQKDPNVGFAISTEGMFHSAAPCSSGYYYSSIIGNGRVEILTDPQAKCEGLAVMFEHQAGKKVTFTKEQADTVCVYRIVSDRFTAKRKPMPRG